MDQPTRQGSIKMSELAPNTLHAALHVERHAKLRALIASSRLRLAGAVNAELARLYWSVGDQLAQEFGRGFEAKNLRRRVQFAHAFPLPEIVATLSRPLSWSHFVNLLPLKTELEQKLLAALLEARQRLARRGVLLGDLDDE
jgi:DUF1016 N-terminal domain